MDDGSCTGWLHRSLAYVPAPRLRLDDRPQLFVTSRKQLRPNQQRITLSISGIGTLSLLVVCTVRWILFNHFYLSVCPCL